MKGETVEFIERALSKCPNLLTLKDLVVQYGKAWGFSVRVIEEAAARAKYFDLIVRGPRYQVTSNA